MIDPNTNQPDPDRESEEEVDPQTVARPENPRGEDQDAGRTIAESQ